MAHEGHVKPEHRAARQLRESGYSRRKDGDIHGDAAADARMIGAGVHQHEAALHKGSPRTKLKLRSGGKVPGCEPKGRPDRRARGGGMDVNETMGRDLPNDAQGNVNERSARAKGGKIRRAQGGDFGEGANIYGPAVRGMGSKGYAEMPDTALDVGAIQQGMVGEDSGQQRLQRFLKNEKRPIASEDNYRAKGGGVGDKKHGRVVINIKAGGGDDQQKMQAAHQAGIQQGAMLGARAAAAKMGGGPGGPPSGAGMPPPGAGGPPGAMPPHPMMPPPGAGGPPGMPPRPMPPGAGPMRSGGALRPRGPDGRFSGGAI